VTEVGANEALTLCTAPGVDMLHTVECPHLTAAGLAALVPATADQIESVPVCSSCRGALDGERRRTFATLDAALEAYQTPLENRPRVRAIAAGLTFSRVWIPSSGSYIGIAGEPGTAAVAYFGKGYADVHRPGGYDREWLPVSGADAGRVGRAVNGATVEVCPTCFTQLPATGKCDQCDQ